MQITCLDFETYFCSKSKYTLKKMTTEEYVRDTRFEVHGMAIKCNGYQTQWVEGRHVKQALDDYKISESAVVAHHAQFDGLILSHHFHTRPRTWFCTLSMGRLLLGNHIKVGLDSLAKHFGLAPKSIPYGLFDGYRWHELSEGVREQVRRGAIHDVDLEWHLFTRELGPHFPRDEIAILDATIRMFTEPALRADVPLLAQLYETEQQEKADLLARLGVTAEELRSNETFAQLLTDMGIDPQHKSGKNGPIYAFAKTDSFMRDLCESEDEAIATLAEARIEIQSTISQSRTNRLIGMASRGPLCVYLGAYGANTTRWSGGDKMNWQNFPRVDKSPLRTSLLAPEGYLLSRNDLSQIECRLLNFLAGQWDVVDKFTRGEDPYVGIASQFYQRPITKADTEERGTGKQAELSCGYGCGGLKFKRTAALGIYGPPVQLDFEDAQRFVDLYRETHQSVVQYWYAAERVLKRLAAGESFTWGPMTIADKCIWLPNGCPLIYDTLEWYVPAVDEAWNDGRPGWRVLRRNGWQKMYGAKLVENVIQALARVVLSEAMRKIISAGIKILLCTHDDLVNLVRDDRFAEATHQCIASVMAAPVVWAPGLPLEVEGYLGERLIK